MLRLKRVRRSYLKGSRPDPTGNIGAVDETREKAQKYILALRMVCGYDKTDFQARVDLLRKIAERVKKGEEDIRLSGGVGGAGFARELKEMEFDMGG
jgi:hypothetical protein